jgi:2-polyprenyl-6-methoxyphenol hydroxylase-like FAD-dependent oxidoreductase
MRVRGPSLKIAIAGGSIGGLSAGLALHTAGFDTHVYERHPGPLEARGAGIVVQPELLHLLNAGHASTLPMTGCHVRRLLAPDGGDGQVRVMPQAFTSWESIYTTLRAAFPDNRYHMASTVRRVEPSDHDVLVDIDSAETVTVNLFIAADGAQSETRRRLLPQVLPQYAGYVAWRGTLDEAAAPAALVRFFDDAFTFCEARSGGPMLVYFIPGAGPDARPGKRRLNWVWYVGVHENELPRLLTDRHGNHHHFSLPIGSTPDSTMSALRDLAVREIHPVLAELVATTPDPFLQTIVDVIVPRMVFGRVCLLGDAAFVVRPHTAGAAAKAARDATVLADALRRADNPDLAFQTYEKAQVEFGLAMTRYGIALGQRWAKVF